MKELLIKSEDYNIEQSTAKAIEKAFTPMVESMTELEPQYVDLVSRSEKGITEDLCEEAKKLRLSYRKVRTSTGKAHKEQKAPYLEAGRFIDGLKNAQKKASDYRETSLLLIETHFEQIEQERINKLQESRYAEIADYVRGDEVVPPLGDMPDNIWETFKAGYLSRGIEKDDASIADDMFIDEFRSIVKAARGVKSVLLDVENDLWVVTYSDGSTKEGKILLNIL